jgi:glyoxylase-like metal-dependent hydrolase (beta-lactamase superfamily II)
MRAILLVGGLTCLATPAAAQFRVEPVAPGVYAAIRTEPPGQAFESNAIFLVGDSGVIVVDAQSSLVNTREVLAALRALTPRPVTHLILTHWHFDHVTGGAVYRDTFPGLEIIAHARTKEALDTGAAARRAFLTSLPEARAYFQGILDAGRSFDGAPLDPDEVASLRSDLALADRYATVPPDFTPAAPTRLVTDRLTLRQGERVIEIRYVGRGHTAGDLVVWLPHERVLLAGDLVTAPTPLVGTTSFPHDFARALDALVALHPAVIVPGHGPVLRGDTYLRQEDALLHALVDQVDAAVARGDTLAAVREGVDLTPFRAWFTEGNKVRRALFYSYVTMPGVARAYEEATRR